MLYFLFLNPYVSLIAAFFVFPLLYLVIIGVMFLGIDALFGATAALSVGIYSIIFFIGLWCYEVWEHSKNSSYFIFIALARIIVIVAFSSLVHLTQGIFELMDTGVITPMDFSYIEKEAIRTLQNYVAKS
jgi:hypothetical protein